MVEMDILGLALDEKTHSPILVLKDSDEKIVLPIWIGAMEAMSISMAVNKEPFSRPMTHDLQLDMLKLLGGEIDRIEVVSIIEGTFYANIVLHHGGEVTHVDSRPSDAIALAVRAKRPILIADSVLETAGAPFQDVAGNGVLKPDDSSGWLDELESLSEDDTKYKM